MPHLSLGVDPGGGLSSLQKWPAGLCKAAKYRSAEEAGRIQAVIQGVKNELAAEQTVLRLSGKFFPRVRCR